jgi:PAS domain S-box-containing protein
MNDDLILSHTLFNHFPHPVVLIDTKTRNIVHFNSAACKKFGYTKKEFLKLKLEDIFVTESIEEDEEYISNVFFKNKHDFLKILQKRKNSKLIHVEVTKKIINKLGKKYLLCICRDNSKRKSTKGQIKSSEEYLRIIFKYTPEAIFVMDMKGGFQDINIAAEKLSGYSKKEIIGKNFQKLGLVVSKQIPRALKLLAESVKGNSTGPEELTLNCKDGTQVEIEMMSYPVAIDNKKFVLGIAHDITERRNAEKLILRSKQDWEDTFNIIPDMITIHDKDFNIIRANESAKKILDLPSLEVDKEAKCYQYYHGVNKPIETCPSCKCFKTGKPEHFELFEPYLNMYIEVQSIPQFDGNNRITGLIHVVRDITKRKQTEYYLIQSKKELSIQATELMDANIALKVLLKQRDNDKAEFEGRIMANCKTLVMPYIEKLKNAKLNSESLEYISILESNIHEIMSAFSQKLSSKYFSFTPKEIQVANLIKEGRQSKDIAEMLNLSFETVNCHRQNIRKKLGIKNKDINLRSYLLSLSD